MADSTFSFGLSQKVNDAQPKRLVEVMQEELEEAGRKKFKQNTERRTKTAVNTLTKLCNELKLPTNWQELTKPEISKLLRRFYCGARKEDGEQYKLTAFHALRYGLSRRFEKLMQVDIVNDPDFKEANCTFENICRALKSNGKGKIQHYSEIEPEDIKKLYQNVNVNTPKRFAS